MPLFEFLTDALETFAPLLAVVASACLIIWAARWLLLRRSLALDSDRRLPRQLILLGMTVLGLVVMILALPVDNATRNQILTVLGLLASGIIALSSTTLISNGMAGVMLRATKAFRTGDFIRINGHFGRVTERGLLDTEIQTEDRELTMLPNLYLITNPVTVVRSSGTLVSVSLSLGYDVHHAHIEPLLLEAAKKAELDEPFVRVLELGNYSVTYRVAGFLPEIKNLLTVRSNLCRSVLDSLHEAGVEIVSPSFMNQRPLAPDVRTIPKPTQAETPKEETPSPEDIMFDKAERAERIEGLRRKIQSEIRDLEKRIGESNGEERKRMEKVLEQRRKRLAALANVTPNDPDKAKS